MSIIILLLLQVIFGSELKLEDAQFKKLIFNHFSNKRISNVYGIQIFKVKNIVSIQIDIKTNEDNLKNTIYQTYKSLYGLSNHYFRELHSFHITYHFENDNIPLTTSANKDCLGRFFNEQSESISTWENNCLNIGSL